MDPLVLIAVFRTNRLFPLVLGGLADLAQKVGQDLGCRDAHIRIGVAEVLKEVREERIQVRHELQIGHGIEHGNPADNIVARQRTDHLHPLSQKRDEARERKGAIRALVLLHFVRGLLARDVQLVLAALGANVLVLSGANVRHVLVLGEVVWRRLAHDILEQAIQQLGAVLDGHFRVGS